MIALVEASSYFQLASLAAMADAGLLPAADERILVLANGSQVPELTTPLQDSPGFEQLAARFDRVVDYAQLMAPRRPAQFNPREDELMVFERLLRDAWDLDDEPLLLVLESIQVNPSQALARIFFDAEIWVHSDGLMSYGPTRNRLAMPLRQRITRTLHVDLVPGLEPALLAELNPLREVLPASALAVVFEQLAAQARLELPQGAALVLGQYLGSLGLLDSEEEFELHLQMLREVGAAGLDTVLFKAHPSASPTAAVRLAQAAADLGLEFRLLRTDHLAETVIALARPQLVVSCFSTGLATARYILDTEVRAVGTGMMLQALAPYENSNRIPLSIIHALFVQDLPVPGTAGTWPGRTCSRGCWPRFPSACSRPGSRTCVIKRRPSWKSTMPSSRRISSAAGSPSWGSRRSGPICRPAVACPRRSAGPRATCCAAAPRGWIPCPSR